MFLFRSLPLFTSSIPFWLSRPSSPRGFRPYQILFSILLSFHNSKSLCRNRNLSLSLSLLAIPLSSSIVVTVNHLDGMRIIRFFPKWKVPIVRHRATHEWHRNHLSFSCSPHSSSNPLPRVRVDSTLHFCPLLFVICFHSRWKHCSGCLSFSTGVREREPKPGLLLLLLPLVCH